MKSNYELSEMKKVIKETFIETLIFIFYHLLKATNVFFFVLFLLTLLFKLGLHFNILLLVKTLVINRRRYISHMQTF